MSKLSASYGSSKVGSDSGFEDCESSENSFVKAGGKSMHPKKLKKGKKSFGESNSCYDSSSDHEAQSESE